MQKDIATIQRGEYKPRHFTVPKPLPQAPPTNVWETKEEEQNPLQRLEQSEFISTEKPQEETDNQTLTLAEISAQLAKKQATQNIETVAPETPRQEIVASVEEPRKSLPISGLKNIPEIDILGLEDFSTYASSSPEAVVLQEMPLLSDIEDSVIYKPKKDNEIIGTPPPKIETQNIMGENVGLQLPKKKTTNKEDEHDILGLDRSEARNISYQHRALDRAPANEIPLPDDIQPKRRLKLPSVSRKLMLVGIILFVGVSAIGGAYILFGSQNGPVSVTPPPPPPPPDNEPTPPPPPPTTTDEPPLPQGAIPVSSDITLTVNSIDEARSQLISSLSDLASQNNLTRILIKLEENSVARYLNFVEILSVLSLTLPSELQNNFDLSNATLFTYGQTEGTRLGFAVRITDKNNTTQAAASWETTAYEDTKTLLSYSGITQAPSEMRFLDNNRNGINIRYLNLLSPDLTVDYAITDTLFIFTTSRDSMFEALNSLER